MKLYIEDRGNKTIELKGCQNVDFPFTKTENGFIQSPESMDIRILNEHSHMSGLLSMHRMHKSFSSLIK